jgi:hypothetical protein
VLDVGGVAGDVGWLTGGGFGAAVTGGVLGAVGVAGGVTSGTLGLLEGVVCGAGVVAPAFTPAPFAVAA